MAQNPYVAMIAKAFGGNVPGLGQLDQLGGLGVNAVGRNANAALNKKMFVGANQAGATLSNGLAPTYTGLCLSNPAASGKNLYLGRVTGAFVVAPAAFIGVGLIQGFAAGGVTAHTTPVTPTPVLIGDATVPVGKVDAACTIVGTPSWLKWLWANSATAGSGVFTMDLEGAVVIPPGGYVAVGTLLAVGPTAGFIGSFEWIEA